MSTTIQQSSGVLCSAICCADRDFCSAISSRDQEAWQWRTRSMAPIQPSGVHETQIEQDQRGRWGVKEVEDESSQRERPKYSARASCPSRDHTAVVLRVGSESPPRQCTRTSPGLCFTSHDASVGALGHCLGKNYSRFSSVPSNGIRDLARLQDSWNHL